MLELFKKYFQNDFANLSNYKFYLAISGGKDSMVLSHLLLKANIEHTLLHCNFNLRGNESDEDQKFVEDHANKHGLSILTKSFEIDQDHKNIQLTARELRYNWFNQTVESTKTKKGILLTAHHLDDSIETFFINLLRGTGLKGLTGIPKVNGYIYRPLLKFSLNDIFGFINQYEIVYRQDSSNNEHKYLRNNIRHSLIPLLEELSPDIRTKFESLFTETNNVSNFLDSKKNIFIENNLIQANNYQTINKSSLSSIDSVILKNVLNDYGIHRSNFNEFNKFLSSKNGSEFYSKTFEFISTELDIHFRPVETQKLISSKEFRKNELPFSINGFDLRTSKVDKIKIDNLKANELAIEIDKLIGPLKIRPWESEDKIKPLGMAGNKLVSDILIDKKVNKFEKESVLVLIDSNERLQAILGILISEDVKITKASKEILLIQKN